MGALGTGAGLLAVGSPPPCSLWEGSLQHPHEQGQRHCHGPSQHCPTCSSRAQQQPMATEA